MSPDLGADALSHSHALTMLLLLVLQLKSCTVTLRQTTALLVLLEMEPPQPFLMVRPILECEDSTFCHQFPSRPDYSNPC